MLYVLNILEQKSSHVFPNCIYTIVMDIGIVILPSWPLICCSQSFRNKLLRTILPKKLHKKFIGSMKQPSKIIQSVQKTIKVLPANPANLY